MPVPGVRPARANAASGGTGPCTSGTAGALGATAANPALYARSGAQNFAAGAACGGGTGAAGGSARGACGAGKARVAAALPIAAAACRRSASAAGAATARRVAASVVDALRHGARRLPTNSGLSCGVWYGSTLLRTSYPKPSSAHIASRSTPDSAICCAMLSWAAPADQASWLPAMTRCLWRRGVAPRSLWPRGGLPRGPCAASLLKLLQVTPCPLITASDVTLLWIRGSPCLTHYCK